MSRDGGMALPLGLTESALRDAAREPEPSALAASVRLRRLHGPEVAAAAATQVMLRRRAQTKFGPAAESLFFTRDGLEQATRPDVARHHAARFRQAGVSRVLDLGCGIGTDAMAFLDAGLQVVAVDLDPLVAEVARANLGGRALVLVGTAEALVGDLLVEGSGAPTTGVFCDPARRTEGGRSWRVEDLSPSWDFVRTLLTGDRVVGLKLGPGLPQRQIPAAAEAEWVEHAGQTVELGLWSGGGAATGMRSALVVPGGDRLTTDPVARPLVAGDIGAVLYEPSGAVLRAGALATLGARLGARLVHAGVAYLTADEHRPTPHATAFSVHESFAFTEKSLRRWVRERAVGSLEIKTRGLDLDPAQLRRRLRLTGPGRATVVLTRSVSGKVVLVVRRLHPTGAASVSPEARD